MSVRVTHLQITNALHQDLHQLARDQVRIREQINTGQRVNKLSDDPAAAARMVQLRGEKQQLLAFRNGMNEATGVLKAGIGSLEALKQIAFNANELGFTAANDNELRDVAENRRQLDQMLEDFLSIANGRYEDEYLHGGKRAANESPPFRAERNAEGEITNVVYEGSAEGRRLGIAADQEVDPFSDGVTNEALAALMNQMVEMRDALQPVDAQGRQLPIRANGQLDNQQIVTEIPEGNGTEPDATDPTILYLTDGNGDPVTNANGDRIRYVPPNEYRALDYDRMTAAFPAFDDAEDQVLLGLSNLGIEQWRIDVVDTRDSRRFSDFEERIGREIDVDLHEATVRLLEAQDAYGAALQSSQTLLNQSLFDYL